MRYKVTFTRYADRYYTQAECAVFFAEERRARGFIADLLDGFSRGMWGHDIDCDSINLTTVAESAVLSPRPTAP